MSRERIRTGCAVACLSLMVAAEVAAAQEARPPPEVPSAEGPRRSSQGILARRGPRLGVSLQTIRDPATDARGARVRAVLRGSPADEAGLLPGDVIVSLNDQDLTLRLPGEQADQMESTASLPAQRLQALAAALEPGDTVDITYLRDGRSRSTRVIAGGWNGSGWTVASSDAGAVAIRAPAWVGGTALRWQRRGLELAPLNPGLGRYFGTSDGVLVLDSGEARALEVRPGDVIQRIGTRPVAAPDDVFRILASYRPDEPVELRIVRHGQPLTVQGYVR